MEAHRIVFKFEGGDADRHRLDPSDFIDHTTAARQLLALHAYFYVTMSMPVRGVLSHGHGYRVTIAATQEGSFEVHWVVEVIAKEVVGYIGRKALEYSYTRFLKDSITSMLSSRETSMPPELRREPVLEFSDRTNAPFIDTDAERSSDWRAFQGRSKGVLTNVSRPVGRSASEMGIYVAGNDNGRIVTIDESALCRLRADALAYRQMQITDALASLKLRNAAGLV